MTVPVLAAAAAALLILVLFSLLPGIGIRRAQDRLAERILASRKTAPALLTRAELVVGRWRRLPGVLAFADGAVSFEGVFGDAVVIPTERIGKIVTGRKLSSERVLFRLEALRITRTGGEETGHSAMSLLAAQGSGATSIARSSWTWNPSARARAFSSHGPSRLSSASSARSSCASS